VWLNPEVKQGPTSSQEQTTPSSSQRDSAPSSLVDKMDVHYSSNELRTVQPQCKICLSCDSCVAFVPCGHLVSCPKCAEGVDKCPICRADIIQLLRTYIQ
ncbi:E3 ubiquitin-protein ligase mib2, partial [Biomphalaria glabrata]